jgi:hypothetical protein
MPNNPKYFILELPVNTVISFFQPGDYGYARTGMDTTITYLGDTATIFGNPLTKTLLTDGINLFWTDSAGKIWETFAGSADQTGSYFTIIKNQPYSNSNPNYANYTIITTAFDCKLYDGQGGVIHLTNGKFRLPVLF